MKGPGVFWLFFCFCFYSCFYPGWSVFRQQSCPPRCSISLSWSSVGATASKGPCRSGIPWCSSFPQVFLQRLFSKIFQIIQLNLARVFISVKNDARINIWQLNSLSNVLQRSFQGKLEATIEICFTPTWVSTFNIMKEKIGDKGFSYSKIKGSLCSNSMLSNFTYHLE